MVEFDIDAWIIVGLAPFIGSFLSLLVVRLPRNEGVVFGRSHCRSCDKTLVAHELIPVLSWLLQGGKCRTCHQAISPVYPLMELAATIVALWTVMTVDADVRVVSVILGWALLTLAIMDARDFFLADELTLPLIPLGIAVCYWIAPQDLIEHLAGAAMGFVLIVSLAWAYKKARGRDGLGFGDAKLMAAAGAWVGTAGIGTVLLYAVCVNVFMLMFATNAGKQIEATTKVPLGTGLAAGMWLTWLYGPIVLAL